MVTGCTRNICQITQRFVGLESTYPSIKLCLTGTNQLQASFFM